MTPDDARFPGMMPDAVAAGATPGRADALVGWAPVAADRLWPLIGPADPPPVAFHRLHGRAPVLLLCEHAGRAFPQRLDRLGLAADVLDQHIAYDIGAGAVTRALALHLDAPAVLGTYSRLLIDPNRALTRADAIPAVSDGVSIPGNADLTEVDRQQRADSFYWPFHQAVDAVLTRLLRRHGQVAVLAIHSFTPSFGGRQRPWQVGVLWDADGRIAQPLIAALAREPDLCIGDNEPYDGREDLGGTIARHAAPRGLPHVTIEVRQDLIATEAGAARWAARLGAVLAPLAAAEPRREEAGDDRGQFHPWR